MTSSTRDTSRFLESTTSEVHSCHIGLHTDSEEMTKTTSLMSSKNWMLNQGNPLLPLPISLTPPHSLTPLTRTCITWSEEGCAPSEPVFIKNPQQQGMKEEEEEDDGLVLSVVICPSKNLSFLLILDAKKYVPLLSSFFFPLLLSSLLLLMTDSS